MGLIYNLEIEQEVVDNITYFNLRVPELPGLLGTGNSYQEAKADIEEARAALFETLLRKNTPIPLPKFAVSGISTFVTGERAFNIQQLQPFEPLLFRFDLTEKQEIVEVSAKELSSGILWAGVSNQGNFEVNAQGIGRPLFNTSGSLELNCGELTKVS